MQNSDRPNSVGSSMGEENVGNSQKKETHSLLAFSSTGMMSTSGQDLNAEHHSCCIPLPCETAEKTSAISSVADRLHQGDCCTKESDVPQRRNGTAEQRSTNHVDRTAFKQKIVLWCLLCPNIVALAFCAHLYGQMREQNEMLQAILKDNRSLRDDYQTVYENYQRLREDFEKNRLRKEVPTKTVEDAAYTAPDDKNVHSSDALLQLLRSNGFGKTDPQSSLKRVKRNGYSDPQEYIESIVTNYLHDMPKVHLKGMNSGISSFTGRFNKYLLWQPDPVSFVHRSVTLRREHHQFNRIKAIEIEQDGIYLVYSQVIVNGSHTNETTWRRDCSHETVVLSYHDDNNRDDVSPPEGRVLMSGFVTQDAEGRYSNHTIPLPRDSSLQMGIFRLFRQDQIRVRIPPPHGDCRFTIFTTGINSSYFGLYRIA